MTQDKSVNIGFTSLDTKEQSKVVVTKDWTIGDVVKKFPASAEVMQSHGLHCVGCHVSYWETLEQGILGHGMSKETLDSMLKQINEKISGEGSDNSGPINVTNAAAEKIKQLMEKEGNSNFALKLGVVTGGCSGFSYEMNFTEKIADNDIVVEVKGVRVIIPVESKAMLEGVKIDFIDALQGAGFKISNPNAEHTCACGSSFG